MALFYKGFRGGGRGDGEGAATVTVTVRARGAGGGDGDGGDGEAAAAAHGEVVKKHPPPENTGGGLGRGAESPRPWIPSHSTQCAGRISSFPFSAQSAVVMQGAQAARDGFAFAFFYRANFRLCPRPAGLFNWRGHVSAGLKPFVVRSAIKFILAETAAVGDGAGFFFRRHAAAARGEARR